MSSLKKGTYPFFKEFGLQTCTKTYNMPENEILCVVSCLNYQQTYVLPAKITRAVEQETCEP